MSTKQLRTEAARRRCELHKALAARDVERVRTALHDLYVDEATPLRIVGELKRPESFSGLVEGVVAAHVHLAAPGDAALLEEMDLNLKHTHASFGLTPEEYGVVVAQIGSLAAGADPRRVDWCVGTRLHGLVKPFRHERVYYRGTGDGQSD